MAATNTADAASNGTHTYSTNCPGYPSPQSLVPHYPRLPQTTNISSERTTEQPENPFAALIPDQTIAVIPEVTLESGVTLNSVAVAYKTYGTLSPTGDNAMVICHALTGSADVGDWWGPLLGGPGKAFDISRFFVVCMNSLGSPYGSASPVNAREGDASLGRYGPEFPLTTVRDDVK
jgi:homoserine O-acetyltransferase